MNDRTKLARHPVLPKLRLDCRIKEINDPGRWVGSDRVALEDLASGLDIRNLAKEELSINSIPDIWARPILFEMALFERPVPDHDRPGHPLNKRITGEWRGLLTLLALREAIGMQDLTAAKIELVNAKSTPSSQGGSRDRNGSRPLTFLEAITKLVPSRSISRDAKWTEIHVLLFGGESIGITSPTTLVCTATDCYGKVQGLSWFDGRYFVDPIPHLDSDQKGAVKHWLIALRESLGNHTRIEPADEEVWNSLLGVLSQFIDDLGPASISTFEMGETSLEIKEGIFYYLNPSIGGGGERSYVELVPSRDQAPHPSILVVDDDIAIQWRIPKRDIKVWGMSTLEQVTPYSITDGQRNVIGGRRIQEVEIWSKEDFFTPTLTVVEQANAFPGAIPTRVSGIGSLSTKAGEPLTPILPLNKRLLDYLQPEDIGSRVIFEQGEGSIRVKLKLKLRGPDGNGKDFDISKDYAFGETQITRIGIPPVIAIWPNFSDPEKVWKAYYVYYWLGSAKQTFAAKPYSFGSVTVLGFEEKDSRGDVKRSTMRISGPPEAFVCSVKVGDPVSGTSRLLDSGIILAKTATPLDTRNKKFQLGVDFGTTGTTVFSRQVDGGGRPLPLEFSDRLLRLTEPLGANLETLQHDFIPPGSGVPYLSVFHDFFIRSGGDLRSVLDGHIRFVNDYRGFSAWEKGIAVDLKWSAAEDDRLRIQAFLEQSCVQAAAELANQGANVVELVYSYPTAFSEEMQNQGFPGIWRRAVAVASELTGMKFQGLHRPGQHPSDEPEPSGITESVAAGLFFKLDEKVKAPTSMGAICIDIGGSTSDIAVWQKDRICWQTSLVLAGRSIFLDLIEKRRAFLKKFVADTAALDDPTIPRGAFYAQADAIIAKETQAIFQKLPIVAGDPLVAGVRRIITLGLSGLLFYIGLTIKYLTDSKVYEPYVPEVLIGGNGARLFHWLSPNGHFENESNTTMLLKKAFIKASELGSPDLVRIKISPRPKFEAAFGLVCLPTLDDIAAKESGVLAGESYKIDQKEGHWNSLITGEMLHKGVDVPVKLSQMDQFIDVFNDFATKPQNQTKKVEKVAKLSEVRSRLHGLLTDQTHPEQPRLLVEPPFILGLKALIDLEGDELPSA